MVDDILKELKETTNTEYARTMFEQPPRKSYVVYLDEIERRGADLKNMTKRHSIDLEMYSYEIDLSLEKAIEKILDKYADKMIDGFDISERTWIESEKLYMRVFSFDYIEKGV